MKTTLRSLIPVILSSLASVPAARSGEVSHPSHAEMLERPGGRRLPGKLTGDPRSGFRFDAAGAAAPIRLEPGSVVAFEGPGPDPTTAYPPFRLELGLGQRISGRLGSVDEVGARLVESSAGGTIVLARPGVHAVVQRLGEVQVFDDDFEAIDHHRWDQGGDPEIVDEPRLAKEHSLRIPAGVASLTCRLPEPIGSGRLEVAFHDTGAIAPGQQWFADLMFRDPNGPETVRAILGWSEESLAVESPGGPALAVQRLERKPGWHRLSVRFGPEQLEIAVDGNDLAHGKGPSGPLLEVRLASYQPGKDPPPEGLAGHFDDLRLVRFAEPVGGLEVDAAQDEVRLVGGDQIFGTIRSADGERVLATVDGKDVTFSWSEVLGLYFRRVAARGAPVEGLLVRLEWRSAPGNDPRDLDQAEGALTGLTDSAVTLATPYAGSLTIPRGRLRRLRVLGSGRRLVIDATVHHLGDQISSIPPLLDPPQPEGGVLDRSFELPEVPPGAAFAVLDVVQVAGEASGLPFSTQIKKGELRTNVLINGKPIDYLNRHIASKNETPERIRLPIPPGVLRPGKNLLRIEQVGIENDPNYLDDLGVLAIALEFDPAGTAGAPERP